MRQHVAPNSFLNASWNSAVRSKHLLTLGSPGVLRPKKYPIIIVPPAAAPQRHPGPPSPHGKPELIAIASSEMST